jgi:uncharacterized protein DUF3499
MRVCAKTRCDAGPIATVALVYITREVVVEDLTTARDPALLDLCAEHLERMVPPRGWSVRDERILVGAVAEE